MRRSYRRALALQSLLPERTTSETGWLRKSGTNRTEIIRVSNRLPSLPLSTFLTQYSIVLRDEQSPRFRRALCITGWNGFSSVEPITWRKTFPKITISKVLSPIKNRICLIYRAKQSFPSVIAGATELIVLKIIGA